MYTDEVQRRLAELAVKHDLLVLSDEIYARIIYGGTYKSMMSYPGMEERTLIIDGFSKSFAMTGWRLGYATAPARIVPALDMLAVNTYTCTAEFSQYGAIEALRDREGATPRMVGEFAKRREQFVRDLNRVPGFRCVAARRRVLRLGGRLRSRTKRRGDLPRHAGRGRGGGDSGRGVWACRRRVCALFLRIVERHP